jgi:N-acetylmuramoyl-L-alanine amidase
VRREFLFVVSFALLSIFPISVWAEGLRVEGVRFGGGGVTTRVVFDLNQKADFRAFVIDDPYRIVIDLPLAEWKTFKSRTLPSNSLIKSYRSGELDEGLSRVILDLRKPAIIKNIFPLAGDATDKDRLVIDLERSSENAFSAQKPRVFGNRQLQGASPGKAVFRSVIKKPAVQSYSQAENESIKAAVPDTPVKAPSLLHKQPKIYTIVVDAGHGGEDPGAEAGGMKEKFITLAVARELGRQLVETGRYKVVLTREEDVYIKLHDRVNISREVKGDLFISIHADKIDRTGVRGASIYTLSEKASDAETARLAEEENNAGFVAGVDLSQETQDVADILLDLAMREKMNESNLLARMLEDAFQRKNVQLLPNSRRSAGFAVLKAPDVPSVLIETGFISNPNEARLLSSGLFQRKAAAAIIEGVDAYFRKIQSLQKL